MTKTSHVDEGYYGLVSEEQELKIYCERDQTIERMWRQEGYRDTSTIEYNGIFK